MNLPVLLSPPADAPLLSVDGAWGARGLELSHWPGNQTPRALRHELSTGCVLAWAALGRRERERLAAGCAAIANNHYDTDGTCALFAARHPDAALERADDLLAAARAGDFYAIPSDRALAVDALVAALVEPDGSPLELAALDDDARHQTATDYLVAELAALLDAQELPHRELWEPVVRRARADLAQLDACARADDAALDLCVFDAGRAPPAGFAPGRHALFARAGRDRVLVAAARDGGVCYRLIVSTLSWFDIPGRARAPRADLAALCARLNEREGALPSAEHAWRAQAATNASPELWFGTAELASFAERSDALRPSRLALTEVRALVERALRHRRQLGSPAAGSDASFPRG